MMIGVTKRDSWTFHSDGTLPSTMDARWVLVFGSNLAGRHGAGAALVAAKHYGARYGVGEGMTGMAYAVPTKGRRLEVLDIDQVAAAVSRFVVVARSMPERMFWVTRVGCGLAGYKDKDIAPLFKDAPANCSFANEWKDLLEVV